MKKYLGLLAALGMFGAGYAVCAEDTPRFTQIKALLVEGDVTVASGEKGAVVPMTKDTVYPFGSTIKTGRVSFADLELSPKNTFRLLAGSNLLLQPNTKNPKLVSLKITEGIIESKLDDLPNGCRYEVQTPVAIVGAVGTQYTVKYIHVTEKEVVLEVVVAVGHVSIRGDGLKIEGDGMKLGQNLTVRLTRTGSGWTATAIFTGAPGDSIMINLWGIRERLSVPAGSTAAVPVPATVTVALPYYINPFPGEAGSGAPSGLGLPPPVRPLLDIPPPPPPSPRLPSTIKY